jgi:hypothetical protein
MALHAKAHAEPGYRQFAEPTLQPVCFDVRDVLSSQSRRALIRAALGVRGGNTETALHYRREIWEKLKISPTKEPAA